MLAERWNHCVRIEEQVNVLRDSVDQRPSFREAGAALQDGMIWIGRCASPQDFGEVVILLDPPLGKPLLGRNSRYERAKVRVLAESHGPAISLRGEVIRAIQNQND